MPSPGGELREVARATEAVRIYGTDTATGLEDTSVYVDVERITALTLADEDGKRWRLILNWSI